VRRSIFECLKIKAQHELCQECVPLAAFQIAVCYTIGFGVARNDDSATFWLGKSLLSRAELEREIETLRLRPRIAVEDERMLELYDKGHLTKLDLEYIYQKLGALDEAEEVYRREISDLGDVLGYNHILVQTQEFGLGGLLYAKGDFQGAETVQEGLK
jgi:tetratricopeptide (TPR) repeat protein